MNVKTIFQILISILIIFLLYIFIKDTFLTTNKDIVDLDLDSNKNVEIKKDIVDPGTNLIEKLNYKSIDALGNEYLLSAETAEESKDDLNVLILKTVSGVIKLKDKSIIYINSDFAKYNAITFDTFFYQNVSGLFEENKIFSNNLDLFFKDNKAIMYNDILFFSKDTKANADEISFNLLNGDIKLKMFDEKKIKVVKN